MQLSVIGKLILANGHDKALAPVFKREQPRFASYEGRNEKNIPNQTMYDLIQPYLKM